MSQCIWSLAMLEEGGAHHFLKALFRTFTGTFVYKFPNYLALISDRKISRRDFARMIPQFQQQSSKNIGVLEETVLRLAGSLPDETLAKYGCSSATEIVKSLNIRRVPGLVALPNTQRDKFEEEVLQHMSDNVLFQEDFSSPEALCKALQDMIQRVRENNQLTWCPEIQDLIIAGLFGLTYLPTFTFPTIQGTTEALFILTEAQAAVVTNQNVPGRCITGPAGTGKTWMLMLSLQKTYEIFMRQTTGKRKILVITYNKALRGYIKDTAEKLGLRSTDSTKEKCKIEYFTVDGLKNHLAKKMVGKAKKRAGYNQKGAKVEEKYMNLDQEDFSQVFPVYYENIATTTLLKNFGFEAIFIDEAQDICSSDEDWIRKLWRNKDKLRKLWVFGDEGQKLTRFLGNDSSLLSQRIATNPDGIQTLDKQCRTTVDIYERFHKVRYETEETFNDEGIATTDDEDLEEEEDGEASSIREFETRVHCGKCNVITSNTRGQKVEEMDMGMNQLPDEIVSKLGVLIKTEKVAAEDIAVICANHEGKDHLKEVLPGMLTKKGNGTLQIVDAEEFAIKCSKVRKQVRKRKSTGKPPIQKKFLMIDTVRRFKGLEAEVTCVCI